MKKNEIDKIKMFMSKEFVGDFDHLVSEVCLISVTPPHPISRPMISFVSLKLAPSPCF